MKDEVFEFFKEKGFNYAVLKRNNRDIKPTHIKAGMVEVYRDREKFRDDQLGRAALREAKKINDLEEYEQELKLNQAVKDLEEKDVELVLERQKFRCLKQKLLIFYGLLIYFGTIAAIFAYPYMVERFVK